VVQEAADLIIAAGLKAEALEDARPAQWSKLIFNSSVNSVAALTGLPHSPHFSDEGKFPDLGHLLHALIDEGKRVAEAAGVRLHEDPWEMNRVGAMTNHPPSMLHDVRRRLTTEIDCSRSRAPWCTRAIAYRGLPAYQGERSGVEFSGRK
jgi:ketopantoate reductase